MKINRHNEGRPSHRASIGRGLTVVLVGIALLAWWSGAAVSEETPAEEAAAEQAEPAEPTAPPAAETPSPDSPPADTGPADTGPADASLPEDTASVETLPPPPVSADVSDARPLPTPPSLQQTPSTSPSPAEDPSTAAAASSAVAASQADAEQAQARQAAQRLIRDTLQRLTAGSAFDAKLTQHIWAQGREVVGVGRYEQAGEETGWFSMEMMVPTASGKCLLQQMSDGRLAWTREQVGTQVRLRRVDVGRLDELVPPHKYDGLRPGLRVGGLVELLQRIETDYDLTRTAGKVDGRRVWVLRGPLREPPANRIAAASEGDAWPTLCPREVLVAIAAEDHAEGFGKGLPVRIEFWNQRPEQVESAAPRVQLAQRNLISLLKIYDVRAINPAPQQHFSFETGESDVQFINETERYVQMFGVQLTAKERVMLLR